MEVYIDDTLVKSKKMKNHIADLEEAFKNLKHVNKKLNPSKCAFGVSSRKFLGFMVSQWGIEANPETIQTLLDMKLPKTIKEFQRLTGRVATLSCFISRATNKCSPFFKTLCRGKNLVWIDECEKTFQELKKYMGSPPVLSKLVPGKTCTFT